MIMDGLASWQAFLLVAAIKVTAITGLALVADRWLRRRATALARHRMWTATLLLALATPLIGSLVGQVMPAWRILPLGAPPIEAAGVAGARADTAAASGSGMAENVALTVGNRGGQPVTRRGGVEGSSIVLESATTEREGLASMVAPVLVISLFTALAAGVKSVLVPVLAMAWTLALIVWTLGSARSMFGLVSALRRERRLTRESAPVSESWRKHGRRLARRLGLRRRIHFGESAGVDTPVTGGALRPSVLVPRAARGWSASRRQVVLAHELVHVRRFDTLWLLVGRCLACLFWFHPLVHRAVARAHEAREQACDEAVLAFGTRPSDYATHLLAIAGSMGGPRPSTMLAMARSHQHGSTQLERRLVVILDASRPKRSSILSIATVFSFFTAGVVLAGVMPAPRAPEAPRPPVAPAAPVAPVVAAPQVAPTAPDAPMPSSAPTVPRAPAPVLASYTPMPGVAPSAPQPPSMPPAPAAPAAPTPDPAEVTIPRAQAPVPSPPAAPAAPALPAAPTPPAAPAVDTATWIGEVDSCDRSFEGKFEGVSWSRHSDSEHDQRRLAVFSMPNGLRMCFLSVGDVEITADGALDLAPRSRAELRTVKDGRDLWLEAEPSAGGLAVYRFRVDGRERPLDDAGRRWMASALAVVEARMAIGSIRGEVGSLRGAIGSIHGEVGSLRGAIGSIRGEEGAMRGRIGSIRGSLGSRRGQIGALRGRIGSLRGEWASASDRRRRQIDREIDEIEAEIDEHEAEYRRAEADAEARIAEIEAEIATVDRDRIPEIEAQIAGLDAESRVAEIEAEIAGLDADRRIAAYEEEIEEEAERLETIIRRLN